MPEAPPNILLIMTDQHRFDTLSSHANRFGPGLPAIDKLARYGTTFETAYCTAPICGPSRGSIMTGLHPSQNGVYSNLGNPCGPLNERHMTIGNRMQTLGYQTVYHGKWHLGGNPVTYGFEEVYENSHDPTTLQEAARFLRDRDWMINKRPFFQIVSFLNPHDVYFFDVHEPLDPSIKPHTWANQHDDMQGKPFPQRYHQRPNWPQSRWDSYHQWYYKCLKTVDDQIAELMAQVIMSGYGSNTWVILTADHGEMAGEHALPFKGPWMYDGVMRVPLIIVPPQRRFTGKGHGGDFDEPLPTPRKTDALASLIDLVPTILDLGGGAADPTLPGRSLLPAARGEGLSDVPLFAEWHQSGRFVSPIRMIRTRRWKYNLYNGYGEELYDMENDPHEMKNLADVAEHAAVKADLKRDLVAHLERTGDPFFSRMPTDEMGKALKTP
jgi:arylsulfatase A-like enzyme